MVIVPKKIKFDGGQRQEVNFKSQVFSLKPYSLKERD